MQRNAFKTQLTSKIIHKQKKQRTYKRNIEERSRNRCCRGRAISIKYSECVSVAFVIHHAMCMRCIISSSVTCLAYHAFPHPIEGMIFFKKISY